jgi:uncharacterized cupin superfamily protein
MQRTVVDGVSMWSVWQPRHNVYFNSYLIATPEGNLVTDPLTLDDATAAQIEAQGGIAWIVITNRDHERDVRAVAERFGAQIAAAAGDAAALSVPLARTLSEGDTILGARVLQLPGVKAHGEIALWFGFLGAVLVGDGLWGEPAGSLRLLPDDAHAGVVQAVLSVRMLRALYPRHVLVGDGAPVFNDGFTVRSACIDARDVYANVVNLDELQFRDDPLDYPEIFRTQGAEVGFLLGATKLAYQVGRIPPGREYCPLHWHTREEELFVVWEGAPTLLSPRGEKRLRRGDVVAFPTNIRGAHKLRNDTDQPATVLMIANSDRGDVCLYPDSDKMVVDQLDLMVRCSPELDYFDREGGTPRT